MSAAEAVLTGLYILAGTVVGGVVGVVAAAAAIGASRRVGIRRRSRNARGVR